eukprot:1603596-Pleurochrysis_carterae.AAC.3
MALRKFAWPSCENIPNTASQGDQSTSSGCICAVSSEHISGEAMVFSAQAKRAQSGRSARTGDSSFALLCAAELNTLSDVCTIRYMKAFICIRIFV